MTTSQRNDRLDAIHPIARNQFVRLSEMLAEGFDRGETRTLFLVFETYRSPERQAQVLAEGASKVGPWRSAHAWGFAGDFVPYTEGHGWYWDDSADWDYLKRCAELCGLRVPIGWDKPHVEHPDWHFASASLRRK